MHRLNFNCKIGISVINTSEYNWTQYFYEICINNLKIIELFCVLLTVNLYYNLVNETNLVHVLFLQYFFNFIYNLYMFRTSLGPPSGGKLYLCDTWYLLYCIADCLVCILHTRQSAIENNKYKVSHKYSCSS
jgi:hypothetical protein